MLSIVAFILVACSLPVFAAVAPRAPSGSPSCYSCPGADEAGFPLASNNNDGTTIFCSYPAFPGEDANDFFCTYSNADGSLTQDHDAGFCPSSASTCSKKRDPEMEKAMKWVEERAAKPATSRPEMLTARMALGKKKAAAGKGGKGGKA